MIKNLDRHINSIVDSMLGHNVPDITSPVDKMRLIWDNEPINSNARFRYQRRLEQQQRRRLVGVVQQMPEISPFGRVRLLAVYDPGKRLATVFDYPLDVQHRNYVVSALERALRAQSKIKVKRIKGEPEGVSTPW